MKKFLKAELLKKIGKPEYYSFDYKAADKQKCSHCNENYATHGLGQTKTVCVKCWNSEAE